MSRFSRLARCAGLLAVLLPALLALRETRAQTADGAPQSMPFWWKQMAPMDLARYTPIYQFATSCPDRRERLKDSDPIIKYLERVEISAMLLASFVNLKETFNSSKVSEGAEAFGLAVKALQRADAANCKIAIFWKKFIKAENLSECPKIVEEYEQLVDDFQVKVNALMPLGVLLERDAFRIPLPLEMEQTKRLLQEACDLVLHQNAGSDAGSNKRTPMDPGKKTKQR